MKRFGVGLFVLAASCALGACQPDAVIHIRNTTDRPVELSTSVRHLDGSVTHLPLQKLQPREMARYPMNMPAGDTGICDSDPSRTQYAKEVDGNEIARLYHLCGMKIWDIATDGKSTYLDIT